jgi:purine-nucleoside phosphorylase
MITARGWGRDIIATDPYALAETAARAVAERTGVPRHDAVVVLGSGWASAVDSLGETVAEVPVAQLPGFRPPVAEGHLPTARSLRLAHLDGGGPVRVLAFLGRTHLYEGHGPAAVAHAVRTAAACGCRTAVLTNANGSLRPHWGPGTGVLLCDHLNLTFTSPVVGPRFVDLSEVYSLGLRAAARSADPDLVEGVYAMLPGPHYETVAEALMLRTLGADVVGMSTVLEAIAAREAGMAVLGLSVVTAVEAVDAADSAVDPEDVVRVATAAATRMGRVIAAVLSGTADPRRPDTPDHQENPDHHASPDHHENPDQTEDDSDG